MLSGLAHLFIELSSACDKLHRCAFCGHQQPEINPIRYGYMDMALLQSIRHQLEPGVAISFHRDGDPLAYPHLGEALDLFSGFTTSLVTHGLTLAGKAADLINRCTTLTVSVFHGDPDGAMQYDSVRRFLEQKGARLPQLQVKIVGDYHDHPYANLPGVRVLHRLLHTPEDNHRYVHQAPTIPEVGICLNALHRPSIDWEGRVYLCNQLSPGRETQIGHLAFQTLAQIWHGETRQRMLDAHRHGQREHANSTCAKCQFWGVPSQWQPAPVKMVDGALIQIQ